MERKWTKGPWKIVYGGADDDGYAVIGSPHRISPIANLEPLFFVPANAHLIAAAPDLYEALDGMLNRYTTLVNSGDAGFWNPETDAEVIAARAALARARGEA
jgi:hypothetical protein